MANLKPGQMVTYNLPAEEAKKFNKGKKTAAAMVLSTDGSGVNLKVFVEHAETHILDKREVQEGTIDNSYTVNVAEIGNSTGAPAGSDADKTTKDKKDANANGGNGSQS